MIISNHWEVSFMQQDNGQTIAHSAIEGFFGQVAKTVVYGGATMARLNSRLLCTFLKRETGRDNREQPTLFLFRNPFNKDKAFRIYSDDEITYDLIEEAEIDPRQATVIFVHGWLGGIHNEYWLSEAKNVALKSSDELYSKHSDSYIKERYQSSIEDDLLESFKDKLQGGATIGLNKNHSDITNKYEEPATVGRQYRPNVIIVDWSEFAHGSLYTATQNSYKVASRLGKLLERLASVGHLRPELMHCLGHSIGAHICGQAARHAFPATSDETTSDTWQTRSFGPFPRRMGRITALDPGGFCYELGIRNETTYLGLRPSDALLTDAYYSNRSPFGNKYQVAQFNVRLNNGFFQTPCSVWRNSSVGAEYFRASVRFALGNVGHNDILSCDHYFATRLSHQEPRNECSYVAYACNNYRDFVRGRCGNCQSDGLGCYSMDFEYQRREPSNRHALEQIAAYSSTLNDNFAQHSSALLPGSVPYHMRRPYYMRISTGHSYCSYTYRVRVLLNKDIQDLRSFKGDAVQLQLLGIVTMKDSSTNELTNGVVTMHGPWLDGHEGDQFGLDNRTLTAMFELKRPEKIRGLVVAYDNGRNRHYIPYMQLIDTVHFDYLSSTDPDIRSKYSSSFDGDDIDLKFTRVDSNGSHRASLLPSRQEIRYETSPNNWRL